MKKVLLMGLLVFGLYGCSTNITSGEVVDKTFTPAHVQTVIVPTHISNGKTSTTIMVPYTYYYSDTWRIKIQQYTEEDGYLTATYRVTEDVYNTVSIGDQFEWNEDMEPQNPEYTRERVEE